MKSINTYLVNENDLKKLALMKSGGRIKFVREILDELNPSEFTMYKVAKDIDIPQSTLKKIEEGAIKNPKLAILEKLANLYNIPIQVLTDSYYEHTHARFTIGNIETEYHTQDKEFNLFDPIYRAKISFVIERQDGMPLEDRKFDESIMISTLEEEELYNDIKFCFSKAAMRRKTWQKKQSANYKLINPGNDEEIES